MRKIYLNYDSLGCKRLVLLENPMNRCIYSC